MCDMAINPAFSCRVVHRADWSGGSRSWRRRCAGLAVRRRKYASSTPPCSNGTTDGLTDGTLRRRNPVCVGQRRLLT